MMIASGSAQLATDIAGDGPDVLLLHAGVADRRAWAPLLERLSPTHRCIYYDARGFGETTYEAEPFSRVADTLAVLDAAGSERAVVIGNSMGGRTALDFALAHPDRVAALVLIAAAISGAPEAADPPEVEAIGAQMEAAEEANDLGEVNRLEARFWLDGINGGDEGRVEGPTRELFLDMNGKALAAPPAGDEERSTDNWDRLGELPMPTLVIVGALDYGHFTASGASAATRIPNATLVHLEGAAHLPVLEADETCLRAITDFVDQLGVCR